MASGFREKYGEKLPSLLAAVDNMPGNIADLVPNASKDDLRRFFRQIDPLLGRLDKGARRPLDLFVDGQYAPSYLMTTIDHALNQMPSGAATLMQNSFPVLVRIKEALHRGVGTDADEIKRLSSSVAADLGAAVERSDQLSSTAHKNADLIADLGDQAASKLNEISKSLEQSQAAAASSSKVAADLRALVNPDGRNRNSLENQARRARELVTEITDAKNQLNVAMDDAKTVGQALINIKAEASQTLNDAQKVEVEAQKILNLSSQAGLAASFRVESNRLSNYVNYYTAGLYLTGVIVSAIAIFYIIPALNEAIMSKNAENWGKISTILLIRTAAVAPFIFLIYFTTKRISQLELLRMDYTEKAVASLAFSGYKDQMDDDDGLIKQLMGSLLIKFSEHPERLLRQGTSRTTAKVKSPGFEVESETISSPRKLHSKVDDPSVDAAD